MKLNTKANNVEWFEYNKATKFRIQPFPFSHLKSVDDAVAGLKDQFIYCLLDWEGVTDENDKTLKCDDVNKLFLFDYADEVREFVFTKARELADKLNAELKN